MPVVTRSDCTQVDIESETAEFVFDGEGLTATITDLEIEFNAIKEVIPPSLIKIFEVILCSVQIYCTF